MNPRSAKILFIDIETAPNLAWVWGKWEQDVIDFEQPWYMLCFAYKWAHEKHVNVVSLPDFSIYKKDKTDDRMLLGALHKILDEADIVVAHNGDRFDIPKINSRLLVNGYKPPSPYRTVDTLKVARSKFGFNSNKLDDLCHELKIGRKVKHTGFPLWKGCMEGDEASWNLMWKYNKHDIFLLEEVYLALRPYMTNHPNMNVFLEMDGHCPLCGSDKVQSRGWSATNLGKRRRYHCQDCGGWSRGKIINIGLEVR